LGSKNSDTEKGFFGRRSGKMAGHSAKKKEKKKKKLTAKKG